MHVNSTTPPPHDAHTAKSIAQAWNGLRDAMALAVPGGGPHGPTIVTVNRAFTTLFDVAEEAAVGRPLVSFLSSTDGRSLRERAGDRTDDEPAGISELAVVKSGSGKGVLVEWELAPVRDDAGQVWGFVSVFRELGESSIVGLARGGRDVTTLTDLPNRIRLTNRLERSVERVAQAHTYTFAVVGVVLEGLGAIEAEFGPTVENEVVEALAWRARQRLRPGDLVARMEGGGLGIFLDHFDPWGSTEEVLARIRSAIEHPLAIAGKQLNIDTVGCAGSIWTREHPATSAREVMDELSHIMSRTGTNGNGAPREPVTPGAQGTDPEKDRPLAYLTKAVRDGQLHLLYLPVMSLDTGAPVGMEALLRWTHPHRGVLPSVDFIDDAERTGLIAHIGRWVLRRACHQIKAWERVLTPRPALPIHLNLSPAEFWRRDLIDTLERQTEEVGVNRSRIQLEVPESAILRDIEAASRVLGDLQEAGFETWLDRFGAGGLPLRLLPTIPVSQVKFSPLSSWGTNDTDAGALPPLLRTALAMGRELGWRVVVTGIETALQKELLQEAGCELGQGFGLCGPVDAAGAGAFARTAGGRSPAADTRARTPRAGGEG